MARSNFNKSSNRSNGRRRTDYNSPMPVITVPTMLEPSFVVPVQFTASTGTTIVPLPSSLAGLRVRITSVRATAGSATAGNVQIILHSTIPADAAATALQVSRQTRVVPVYGGPTELVVRQDRRVAHGVIPTTVLVPSLLTTVSSVAGDIVGVYMVSVLGPM